MALVGGGDAEARPLVEALREGNAPWSEGVAVAVCFEPRELLGLAPHTRVVLIPSLDHAEWLNLNRPVVSERALRVFLWVSRRLHLALRRRAPDFMDWMSRRVEVPQGSPGFAVDGLRAAWHVGAWVSWRGEGLEESLALALPATRRVEISARAGHDALVRAARRGLLVVRDVGSNTDFWKLRIAWSEARSRRSVILLNPSREIPGIWRLHAEPQRWEVASERLSGWPVGQAGLVAGWMDLEPEALDLVATGGQEPRLQAEARAVATASVAGPTLRRFATTAPVRRIVGALRRASTASPGDDAARLLASEGAGSWTGEAADDECVRLCRMAREGGDLSRLALRAMQARQLEAAASWASRSPADVFIAVSALNALGRGEEAFQLADARVRATERGEGQLAARVVNLAARAAASSAVGTLSSAVSDLREAVDLQRQINTILEDLPGQERLCELLRNLGTVLLALGNAEAAVACLQESVEGWRRRQGAQAFIESRGVLFAEALLSLGDAQRALGRVAEARVSFEAALEQVSGTSGTSAEAQDGTARRALLEVRLGDLERQEGHVELARTRYSRALESLPSETSGRQMQQTTLVALASAWSGLSSVLAATGDLDGAFRGVGVALERLSEAGARESADSVLVLPLAQLEGTAGELEAEQGRPKHARRHYQRARRALEGLLSQQPDRLDALRLNNAMCDRLADLRMHLGDPEGAMPLYLRSLEGTRSLVERAPEVTELRHDLAVSLHKVGHLYLSLGDLPAARAELEAARKLLMALEAEQPERLEFAADLGQICAAMATLEPERAMEWLDRAIEAAARCVSRAPGMQRYEADLAMFVVKRAALEAETSSPDLSPRASPAARG